MKIKQVIDMHYSMFIFIIDERDEEQIKEIEDFCLSCKNSAGRAKIFWKVEK